MTKRDFDAAKLVGGRTSLSVLRWDLPAGKRGRRGCSNENNERVSHVNISLGKWPIDLDAGKGTTPIFPELKGGTTKQNTKGRGIFGIGKDPAIQDRSGKKGKGSSCREDKRKDADLKGWEKTLHSLNSQGRTTGSARFSEGGRPLAAHRGKKTESKRNSPF